MEYWQGSKLQKKSLINDTRLQMDVLLKDGTPVKNGDIAFIVDGPQISILLLNGLY